MASNTTKPGMWADFEETITHDPKRRQYRSYGYHSLYADTLTIPKRYARVLLPMVHPKPMYFLVDDTAKKSPAPPKSRKRKYLDRDQCCFDAAFGKKRGQRTKCIQHSWMNTKRKRDIAKARVARKQCSYDENGFPQVKTVAPEGIDPTLLPDPKDEGKRDPRKARTLGYREVKHNPAKKEDVSYGIKIGAIADREREADKWLGKRSYDAANGVEIWSEPEYSGWDATKEPGFWQRIMRRGDWHYQTEGEFHHPVYPEDVPPEMPEPLPEVNHGKPQDGLPMWLEGQHLVQYGKDSNGDYTEVLWKGFREGDEGVDWGTTYATLPGQTDYHDSERKPESDAVGDPVVKVYGKPWFRYFGNSGYEVAVPCNRDKVVTTSSKLPKVTKEPRSWPYDVRYHSLAFVPLAAEREDLAEAA
jgi:hypothetical protein